MGRTKASCKGHRHESMRPSSRRRRREVEFGTSAMLALGSPGEGIQDEKETKSHGHVYYPEKKEGSKQLGFELS